MRTCTNQSISRFSITAAVLLVLVLCSEQPEYVSVLFTGDVMLDRGVRNAVAWKEPDILFNHVRDIFAENDFVFINLECPLTTVVNPAEKEYVFRGDPSWIPALTRAGVTHASLGNNHILDQGGIGAQETVDSLRAHDIEPVWIRGDFLEPAVIRRNGVIVGVYSVNLLPDTLSGVSFDMLIDSMQSSDITHMSSRQLKSITRESYFTAWGISSLTSITPVPTKVSQFSSSLEKGKSNR